MKKRDQNKYLFIVVCMVLPVTLFGVFVIYPALDLIRMSFTQWDGLAANKEFIGISNYRQMVVNSPELWKSLKNNGIYFFAHLLFIPFELFIAVLLDSKLKGANAFKSITFMPYIINGVAIAYAFSYFFTPYSGALNQILTTLGLEDWIQNWLSNPKIVNYSLVSVSLWRYTGFHIVLFLAGLQSIPKDMVEAATIDGANFMQKFRFIIIPSITLVIDFVLFSNVRGALQAFDIPFIMTGGGPGYASSTFTLYTLKTAFDFNDFGMASAMGVTIIIMIIVVSYIQNKLITLSRGK